MQTVSVCKGNDLLPSESNRSPCMYGNTAYQMKESSTLPPKPLRHVEKNMLSCSAYAGQASHADTTHMSKLGLRASKASQTRTLFLYQSPAFVNKNP